MDKRGKAPLTIGISQVLTGLVVRNLRPRPPPAEPPLRRHMPPPYVKITPSARWPSLIDDVLSRDHRAHEARVQMWNEVGFYVEQVLDLPIGPLNENEEARRDIAVRVLAKLEAHEFAHIKEWRRRQRLQRDHASWWTWIRTIARRTAIDFARGHEENVAPRGKPFEWVKIEPSDPLLLSECLRSGSSTDPFVMTDMLRKSLEFLDSSDEQALVEYLNCFPARAQYDDATIARSSAFQIEIDDEDTVIDCEFNRRHSKGR
jgi:hypothetical protein